nr:MAG TPA: hypothetical protein [Caudoviricetes sp.]
MCTRKCRNNGAFGVYLLAASFTSVFLRAYIGIVIAHLKQSEL